MIYDNADDTSFLHHALPRYGNGSVLITSRDPDVISMAACESCAVHPLEEDAAASLFSQVADYSGEAAEQDLVAKSMAQRLGGLPLAIVQVANAITQAMVPLHGILSFYDENLEAINASQIDLGGYERTLATVWECTLRSLSGQSRHLANIFCLLDPDAIDEKLLTEGAKVEGSELFRFMQYMNR